MRIPGVLLCTAPLLVSVILVAQTPVPAKPVLVIFETELGKITMEVDIVHAPITGENFLKYVDGGFYNGGAINRAVRPDNTTRHDVEIQVIQFQISPQRNREQFPPIPMERTSVTGLKHVNGALSMARSGPDTARASFSIVIGDQPEMDFGGKRNADGQGFAVFGHVVEGMDIVKKIQSGHTLPAGERGAYGTETLDPPVKILKAYRESSKSLGDCHFTAGSGTGPHFAASRRREWGVPYRGGSHRETSLDVKIMRSWVRRGMLCARHVATITRSAGSRWKLSGSEATSSAMTGVIGMTSTVRGWAAACSHSPKGT